MYGGIFSDCCLIEGIIRLINIRRSRGGFVFNFNETGLKKPETLQITQVLILLPDNLLSKFCPKSPSSEVRGRTSIVKTRLSQEHVCLVYHLNKVIKK